MGFGLPSMRELDFAPEQTGAEPRVSSAIEVAPRRGEAQGTRAN